MVRRADSSNEGSNENIQNRISAPCCDLCKADGYDDQVFRAHLATVRNLLQLLRSDTALSLVAASPVWDE
jgi:hypothetical protein